MATLQLHYFKPNMLQTPNAGIKDSEVDNRLERDILLTFSKDAKSVAGFPSSQQSWAGQTDVTQIQYGCQDSFKMATSEVASLIGDEFLLDNRDFRGFNFGEWKS